MLRAQQRQRLDRDGEALVGRDAPDEDDLRLWGGCAHDRRIHVSVAWDGVADPLEHRLEEDVVHHALDRMGVPRDRRSQRRPRIKAQRRQQVQRAAARGPDRPRRRATARQQLAHVLVINEDASEPVLADAEGERNVAVSEHPQGRVRESKSRSSNRRGLGPNRTLGARSPPRAVMRRARGSPARVRRQAHQLAAHVCLVARAPAALCRR